MSLLIKEKTINSVVKVYDARQDIVAFYAMDELESMNRLIKLYNPFIKAETVIEALDVFESFPNVMVTLLTDFEDLVEAPVVKTVEAPKRVSLFI